MALSETCARCGEEVRWGWRHGQEAYWHRVDVDHLPLFGHSPTAEELADLERELDRPRTRRIKENPEGFPLLYEIETYTTREHDEQRYLKNKKYREAQEADATDEDEEGSDAIEPIEVHRTDMPFKGVLSVETPYGTRQVPVPGGVRTLINLAEKVGWEITRLTYARGPYLGASGKSLGVSDTVVMHIWGPVVDGRPTGAVASWRDGKSDRVWLFKNGQLYSSGARALAAWMKEAPRG